MLTAIVVSLSINGFVVLANLLAVSKHGTDVLLSLSAFAGMPLMFAFLASPFLLVGMFWKRFRGKSLRLLLFAVIYLAIGVGCHRAAFQIRRSAFSELALRSRPLVTAIHQFEGKYGKPPESLSQLSPEFLPQVPQTGIRAYPDYRYEAVTERDRYEGNPWVITVRAPTGVMNWDQFIYFPKQNYPEVGYGGVIERVEDWAYVHE